MQGKIEKLISQYLKKGNESTLHNLRKRCREYISFLEKEGKYDENCLKLMKLSSKVRTLDVLIKICPKYKKILMKKRESKNKRLILFLREFSFNLKTISKQVSLNCKNLINKSFFKFSDKELHKLRLEIKKCRYV